MASSRLSSMVVRNLITSPQGLVPNGAQSVFILGRILSSGHGTGAARFYGSASLGANGTTDYYLSSQGQDVFTKFGKRAELNSGSYWNLSPFVATRSASTVSGKVVIDDQIETAGVKVMEAENITGKEDEAAIDNPPEHEMEKLKEKGLVYSRYWGLSPSKVSRKDGSLWPWNSFRPWETYTPDLSIDLKKHHVPETFLDKFAFWTVKALRFPTDLFFQIAVLYSIFPRQERCSATS